MSSLPCISHIQKQATYQRSLNQFIQENDLEGELQQARNDILNTAKNLDDLLNDQPNLRKDYQKIFTGTQYALQ